MILINNDTLPASLEFIQALTFLALYDMVCPSRSMILIGLFMAQE